MYGVIVCVLCFHNAFVVRSSFFVCLPFILFIFAVVSSVFSLLFRNLKFLICCCSALTRECIWLKREMCARTRALRSISFLFALALSLSFFYLWPLRTMIIEPKLLKLHFNFVSNAQLLASSMLNHERILMRSFDFSASCTFYFNQNAFRVRFCEFRV